jgi:hypothetical protein
VRTAGGGPRKRRQALKRAVSVPKQRKPSIKNREKILEDKRDDENIFQQV